MSDPTKPEWASDAEFDDDEWDDVDDVPLTERLRRVMEDIGPVEKEQEYAAGNVSYKFRGIEQITPKVRDAMVKHGVVFMPVKAEPIVRERVFERGDGKPPAYTTVAHVVMTYRFMPCNDSADFIDVQTVALANDTGDKALTKALTSAFKYVLLQSFCIADPNDDQDRYSGEETAHELSAADIDALRVEWAATEDQVETLRVAAAMMSEQSKQTFAAWWKATGNVGNLREGRVNARYIPAAMALVQALLDEEQQAAEDAAADPT